MARSNAMSEWTLIPSIFTIAGLQLRQIWRLLVLTCVGVIVAVVLACSIPLFSLVSMSAGVHSVLDASSTSSYLYAHTAVDAITPDVLNNVSSKLNGYVQQYLGQYSHTAPQVTISTPLLSIKSGDAAQAKDAQVSDRLQLFGMDINTLAPHIRVLEGRLPDANSGNLEMALTRAAANYLQVRPGSILSVPVTCTTQETAPLQSPCLTLSIHVVGVIAQTSTADPVWHGVSLQSGPLQFPDARLHGYSFPVLVSNTRLVNALSTVTPPDQTLAPQANLTWYYALDKARINVNTLSDLTTSLDSFSTDIPTYMNMSPYFEQLDIQTPSADLEQYSDHVAVAQIPIVILALLIMGLLLLFQSIMGGLLVERQTNVIALLGSRGSSSRQIFGAFVVQILLLSLVALVAGALLAVPFVRLLVQYTLAASDQEALVLIAGNPITTALSVWWAALAVLMVSIATMVAAVHQATHLDVLALRRESSRNTRRPLWVRLYLDFILVILALGGYGFSIYMQHVAILDPSSRVLLESPLALVSVICLLIGCALILLRFIPQLLSAGGRLTSGTRRVGPMLALAQMARSPQQTLRMTLLLTFSTTFVIFVLIFNASQSQHIQDIATYQVGADFSGNIQPSSAFGNLSLKQQQATFGQIGGVTAASVGSSTYTQLATSSQVLKLLAVEPASFAQSTLWSDTGSYQTLQRYEKQLARQQGAFSAAVGRLPVTTHLAPLPALVDSATWHTLKLAPGRIFSLKDVLGDGTTTTFVALAQVAHLPTVDDLAAAGQGRELGLLVDYQSASDIYEINTYNAQVQSGDPLAENYVWLRTNNDPSALANVRQALSVSGRVLVDPLFDRASLIAQGYHDPLYLSIIGVLSLGALAPVLLALISNLIASWMSVYGRMTNFAMLRALGTSPRQLISILSWEQGIVYTAALGLGLLFGLLLSFLTLPALVFTNGVSGDTPSSAAQNVNFYALQSMLPIHVVIPTSLLIVICGLILTCVIVLVVMLRTISRPVLSQTLRLNQD